MIDESWSDVMTGALKLAVFFGIITVALTLVFLVIVNIAGGLL
jgi:hypothetical protein